MIWQCIGFVVAFNMYTGDVYSRHAINLGEFSSQKQCNIQGGDFLKESKNYVPKPNIKYKFTDVKYNYTCDIYTKNRS